MYVGAGGGCQIAKVLITAAEKMGFLEQYSPLFSINLQSVLGPIIASKGKVFFVTVKSKDAQHKPI